MKLGKTYDPQEYEAMIYDLWEQSGAFKPKEGGEPFVTVMPPPNANANLHIGHALNNSLQDIAVRYQRMQGKSALFLPGADHAGFETQVVYEKQLTQEGKSRFDFSRDELYARIYEFVQANRGNMEKQVRAMGASVDWSRAMFTLDEQVVKTTYGTFKKMWEDKLIYRGERLVNYCTFHRTGFADIEVSYEERTSPLYYLKYGPFTLATTRPETKFGDTAVAVHPDDKRYKEFIGKVITAEGLNGPFEIRVVADQYVDPAFGTGAVKITPAHDFNDWEIAQRHNLEAIRVINHDGMLNHRAGQFEGMPVAEARIKVAAALKDKGLLEKIDENYRNRVGVCYKCGTVIEPMLLDQWFIDMKRLAAPAIKELKRNKIAFHPTQKLEQTITYLETVKDWNISRQIAWGIPIPAFQNTEDPDDWIFDDRANQEIIELDGKTYRRDADVFDTWFSSGHWPFVTLDYPDNPDFKRFYPNDLMETGIDILYQWVARMIALGLYVTGVVPFKNVYLHGMVRSEDGRKMSKSLGNVLDPQQVIASHGSDALRMGIISGRSPGLSAAYDPSKIDAARNFCNKLWNIARFVEDTIGDNYDGRHKATPETPADHWILLKLQHATEKMTLDLENYRFSEAYDTLYHTVWDDFADWYIEASKSSPNHGVLAYGLETLLKLAHPFAPFVSETIWQTLKWEKGLLISSSWPVAKAGNKEQASVFSDLQAIITEIRSISRNLHLSRSHLYHTGSQLLTAHGELIARMAHLKGVSEVSDGKGLRLTSTKENCWLDVDQETARSYLGKLEEQQTAEGLSVERMKARLANKSYVSNAPKELVAETKSNLAASEHRLQQINSEIDAFAATAQDV
ncbi:valine--tRNA ligase [Candidatus Saccharibacteria bacterium]|nr:valine--tRNA ligase [Candidatus Saccharibacteria bacterium]